MTNTTENSTYSDSTNNFYSQYDSSPTGSFSSESTNIAFKTTPSVFPSDPHSSFTTISTKVFVNPTSSSASMSHPTVITDEPNISHRSTTVNSFTFFTKTDKSSSSTHSYGTIASYSPTISHRSNSTGNRNVLHNITKSVSQDSTFQISPSTSSTHNGKPNSKRSLFNKILNSTTSIFIIFVMITAILISLMVEIILHLRKKSYRIQESSDVP
ncbi:hypothetical protein RF11_10698 [Thelohanellus kitauei]|uniref:Uncharacterized protein n=1 Tax=Thelohanellus kitauei TaxID=669202 RepID=A0A0C2ME37_THEKT|nr:hypothetical protein RF11_10698 [Thelohanellus kitauei]